MEGFKSAYAHLNDAQKKAVDKIDGPVLVIAGPGTGKTHLLTTRIANILQKTDSDPQNILCLTFTDSAVHTLRERLTNLIGQAAYDVSISTYHAFGSELIRRYREYFVENNELHPIDELGIDSLLREVVDKLPYNNPLRGDFYIGDIKSLLSDSKRAVLSPADIRKVVRSNQTLETAVNRELSKIFKVFRQVDKQSAPLFQTLAETTKSLSTKRVLPDILGLQEAWQKSLEQAIEEWQESGKTKSLTQWKNRWLVKNEDGHFVMTSSVTSQKLLAFADIYESYEYELRKRGLFDYDDMIGQAIRGLEEHPDLRFTLQERYQYILLDEFQDTNGAQLKLIELLTDNPANEGQPNILAVGDDDQAIYAFQGADYSHMLAFSKMYKNTTVIPLVENYRSTESILHLASNVADQVQERLHYNFPDINKQLVAKVAKQTPTIVQRDEFKTDVAQFAWVARSIKELIEDGMSASDIVVIAPQHRYLEPLVPYLHHTGLAVRYEKRENVLDDPDILTLYVMTKLVIALRNQDYVAADALWPEVLSADCWQLPTESLWQLSWIVYDTKKHWNNVIFDEPLTRDIGLFFTRLSTMERRETLETMLDYLMGINDLVVHEENEISYRSPFFAFSFGSQAIESPSEGFWGLLSNLTVLRQHLREYRSEDTKPLTLEDFVVFIDAHREAHINIINTSPYYESLDAVQLMTAYKAKGQEFQAVFVLGCLDNVWGNSARRQSSSIVLPANLQFIRYAGATNDEQLRLFYVAITRAKRQLYLTSYLSTYTNKPLTRLKFLSETVNDKGVVDSPLLPTGSQIVHQTDSNAPVLATLTIYWQQRHYEAARQASLRALLTPRLQFFQLSPTHINQFVDVLRDGPKYFFINTLLHFPKGRLPSAEFGNAMHETLEWLHLANKEAGRIPSEARTFDTFERRLQSKRLSQHYFELLSDRGRDALHTYLKQRKDTIRATNESEFNFRQEGVFINDAHLTGNIDKLIIDKERKKITIVDYKTGRNYTKWSNDLVLHKYRQQLYCYKVLVEKSHTFAGYEVEDAYLEFVEPDSHDNIIELHLKFDTDEQKAIEQLAVGVWWRIMQLDFPDVSSYTPSVKGIEEFETFLRLMATETRPKKITPTDK